MVTLGAQAKRYSASDKAVIVPFLFNPLLMACMVEC